MAALIKKLFDKSHDYLIINLIKIKLIAISSKTIINIITSFLLLNC